MLGLCCQYLETQVNKKGKEELINIVDEKILQYGQFLKGKYTIKQIEEVWEHNANDLMSILKRINSEGIKSFRISSSLFPLYDSLTKELKSFKPIKNILQEIGKFVVSNKMRLTSHPDQFVVISSNKQEVIDKSFRMLDYHAWVFDQMELEESPYYAINIHGGTKGNSTILINSIKNLNTNVSKRLTLENDESSYNVKDLYQVYEATGTPIVYDTHHHVFNDANLSIEEGLILAKSSWSGIKPLTHLSNTEPSLAKGSFTDRRKHSDYVHYIPDCQALANNNNEIDVDLEFKMKNLAIFKAVKDFQLKLS